MLKRYIKRGLIATVALMLASSGAFASHLIDEASILKGKVVSVVTVGQTVTEGDELVRIKTLSGSITAARATVNGTIAEVYVEVGDTIGANTVVAQIAVE
ncbi:MAG: hypothetical protein IJN28_08680 [Selenomonadales bacterium]|nr:hypothetical protein [Selenomonadales bacterium]